MTKQKKVKVTFRGIEKKALKSFCQEVCEHMVHIAKKRKNSFSKRILQLSVEEPKVVASIVLFTIAATVSNIDRIPTRKLEGVVIDDELIPETIREFISREYIA